jgi:hypothetical protein
MRPRWSRARSPGRAAELEVDHARRGTIRANHSATHLLHEALREALGSMWRRRARWSRPTGCASTSRIPSRCRPRNWRGRDRGQRDHPAERPVETRLMAVDDAHRDRRAWRCSARNTATRCGSCRWAHARGRGTRPRPIRSSCAAAPMSAHRRDRALRITLRSAVAGRAPDRGADRRGARAISPSRGISAVDLVRARSNLVRAASALGGKGGGGRPDMAQAGGPGRRHDRGVWRCRCIDAVSRGPCRRTGWKPACCRRAAMRC